MSGGKHECVYICRLKAPRKTPGKLSCMAWTNDWLDSTDLTLSPPQWNGNLEEQQICRPRVRVAEDNQVTHRRHTRLSVRGICSVCALSWPHPVVGPIPESWHTNSSIKTSGWRWCQAVAAGLSCLLAEMEVDFHPVNAFREFNKSFGIIENILV